jgi:dihydroxyacetone kinase
VKVNYSPQAVFALYPNPASRFVDVDLRAVQGERLTISIVNNIGQTVYTEKVESAASKKRLEVDKLDVGQYIISIQPEGKQAVATRLNVVR